jgi:signal transduction histidine kinase/CheY-like chemotaxis protein
MASRRATTNGQGRSIARQENANLKALSASELGDLCQQQGARLEELEGQGDHSVATDQMETLGMFAGGIAHDFNNILGIISNRATLALVARYSDPELCEHMKQVIRATERGKELIKQIMTFSRPDPGELPPLALATILEDTASFLALTLPESIKLKCDFPGEPVIVRGDATQISQILMNLVTNSVAAMPRGGAVTLRLTVAVGQARLEVEDTGEGVSESVRARIFEPFFTTRRGGRGTGLGLAVVQGIVKRHGGTVACESWVGQGTRFVICLPLYLGKLAPVAQPQKQQMLQSPSMRAGKTPQRILFVDDETELALSGRKLLESFGHLPSVFTSPAKALEFFDKDPFGFDIVITDMLMPGIDGKELARELLARNPAVPIILCTGYSEAFSKQDALDEGFRGYVPKPIDWLELGRKIDEIIAARTLAGNG